MQVLAGVSQFVEAIRRFGAFLGVTTAAAMLAVAAVGYERLAGRERTCLRFLGVERFGPANVLVLAASVGAFCLSASLAPAARVPRPRP